MLDNLVKIISRTVKMSGKEIELCKTYFEPITISRNTVLEEEGKTPQYLYFVSSGFMRLFYYDENGDEQTTYLCSPNGFITFTNSFVNLFSSYDAVPLPLTFTAQRPPNSIFGAWMDIDVSQTFSTGTITYETVGAAPFRALIVKWINCSYFGPDVWQHSMNWRQEIFVSDMWEFGGYSNFAIENSFSHSQNWSHHI